MTALARALSWFMKPPSTDRSDEPSHSPPTVSRFAPPTNPGAEPGSLPASAASHAPRFAPPGGPASAPAAAGGAWAVTSAAVLGRPGEAEPLAAALALALGRSARSRAATVVVLGAPDVEPPSPATGGTRAARRHAERLAAHGLAARPRGQIVWVRLPADGDPAKIRRAALVGAPAVLAVTVPRSAALEPLLSEQDLLLLVTADPDGPLARLAADAHGTSPVLLARPLGRGPARSLARGGVRPARAIRELLASAGIQAEAR